MNRSPSRSRLALAIGAALCATAAFADGTRFSDIVPLAASSGPTADESMPITFANPAFQQRSLADRTGQLDTGAPNSGSWDMITSNETGPWKSRYLLTVFETGQAGVQRHDLWTGQAETIWQAINALDAVAFDASYWTPWGTFITAEESWQTVDGGSDYPYGRLFEFRNPLTAPGIVVDDPASLSLPEDINDGADFVHRNVIPRTSHEGIQFDKAGNMYFIDELNGGCIYRYTPAAKFSHVLAGRADYFAAGQTAVLRVGNGGTPNATGAYEWVPITDAQGAGLPGVIVNLDTNGVTSVDARNTTDLGDYKGTDYQRPEDLQIQTVNGREFLYIATTTTNEVYRLDLAHQTITVFANQDSTDLATGAPVNLDGAALRSPDNLAIDKDGFIYVVEDRPGGGDDDIWLALDLNLDGDLEDDGEGLARWASNGTPGSEFTGLYFDPQDKRRAWVNIQHPASENDRLIEITIE